MLTLRDLIALKSMGTYSRDHEVAAILARQLFQELKSNNLKYDTLESLRRHLESLPAEARRVMTRTHSKVTIEQTTERIEEK